jgi:hypothetical protein
VRPYLEKILHKKRTGGVVQGVGLELRKSKQTKNKINMHSPSNTATPLFLCIACILQGENDFYIQKQGHELGVFLLQYLKQYLAIILHWYYLHLESPSLVSPRFLLFSLGSLLGLQHVFG